jgi:hypothetical protein
MPGDLRRQLGSLPRAAVDHALTQMHLEGAAELGTSHAGWELTGADRAAAILINGERRHRIAIRGAGQRPRRFVTALRTRYGTGGGAASSASARSIAAPKSTEAAR